MLVLEIPGTPPTGNMYIRHTRSGRHYRTEEADRFYQSVAIIAAGRKVEAKQYKVSINVTLGPKQRGDVDNFCKVALDCGHTWREELPQ